ncbi:hypothetical protein [Qingshengfaniella alkalisoli]|uniref:Uncharacterized protein n=1 Tax=Qingshengfaniella alkalisoli TaxID=2599296 RepID=A0A5B8IWT8_9RHOB|nr:hypothetical protein [Qingshengfaniella alkalisoli]QDY69321.1 hypothetical protein FPZ52_06545 [Qingshengfaniella alkalisoli]
MTSLYIESETTVSQTYPTAPAGLSTEAAAIPAAIIWDMMEAYCNTNWSESVVDFNVDAPPCGIQWKPPYVPFAIDEINGETATDFDAFGQVALTGMNNVRCTIGGADVTPAVEGAYVRLAEYIAAAGGAPAGVTRYSIDVGDISESWSRKTAQSALAASGAASYLTRYRKAGKGHV